MNAKDIREFAAYLKACTNRQVIGVLEKERAAGRTTYTELALIEAGNRNLI